jgi:hypothetical protein
MTRLLNPANPAKITSFPPTLPMEIAMRIAPAPKIFQAYGLDETDYARICADPIFLKTLEKYVEELEDPKNSFRMKARLQSEVLLDTSWDLIHARPDQVPATVKKDLITATWRMAGLDASREDNSKSLLQQALQVNIFMGED